MNGEFIGLNKDLTLLHKNWGWFLVFGILLVVLGIAAISVASMTTLVSIIFLGSMILLGGIVLMISAFKFSWGQWGHFTIDLLMSLLYILAGLVLIENPVFGAVSFTLILAIFYIILGIMRIASSLVLKLPEWGWGLFSGIIALLLGILILAHWPASALYIIGLFIGIDLILFGFFNIRLGLAAKKIT
ncbi:MAG: HdeD family acid-resistance protein [Gammaproteobacteria bacterium]